MKRRSDRPVDVNPSRRRFLKAGALTTAALAGGPVLDRMAQAEDDKAAEECEVKIAGYAYDRVRAIADGRLSQAEREQLAELLEGFGG